MKSDIIAIKNDVKKDDIEKILSQVEKLADLQNLSEKQSRQLRLLTEELLGFEKGILGFSEGEMYIENKGMEYKVCLHSDVQLDVWTREYAADCSSTHKNAAYSGFKGKLRKIVDTMCDYDALSPTSMETAGYLSASPEMYAAESYDYAWSMSEYREQVKKDTEEWDMLEHSILANLADDVIVAARKNFIDIIVVKKF